MLLYSNQGVFRQLFQLNGSVVFGRPYLILTGLFLASVTAFLQYLGEVKSPFAPSIPNNYGIAAFGMFVSFSIIFRTNLAWSRYWEGLSQVHFMYSKWGDAFLQLAVFCNTSLRHHKEKQGEEIAAKCKRLQVVYSNAVKYFSLLSAMAADRIHHGDTQRMDMRLQMSGWRDQVVRQRDLANQDLTGWRILPDLQVGSAHHQQELEVPWQKLARKSRKEAAKMQWQHRYVIMEMPSAQEQDALLNSDDRVSLCLAWITETLAMAAKDLTTPPPIQSRMYQELSNGSVGFTNCLKISDTPFPFCYSQLAHFLLFAFCLCVPIFVTALTQSYFAGPALTFFIIHSIACLNELAKILENPFGRDTEDICVEDFHRRFLHLMEDTRTALHVDNGMLLGESRKSEWSASTGPEQTENGQLMATTEATNGSEVAALAQNAPGSSSVTGVWCELPQQSQQQGEERWQGGMLQHACSQGVLQHLRSSGASAAQNSILQTTGNNSLLAGVGCWRGLLSPDREARQSKELACKGLVDGSSKATCATWVSRKDEPCYPAAGLNTGITAQDNRGTEPKINVSAENVPAREQWLDP